jgi:hypothetical protein
MAYLLNNKFLELSIDAPLEGYHSSRFDWTGKITSVKFRGIPLTGVERPDGQDEDQFGKGFYNEFGVDNALGFEEADTGGWFHKIGVGLLKKDGDPYLFSKPYPIDPATFDFLPGSDRVSVFCTSKNVNGYAYVLRKDIELHENGFAIHYNLVNTGEKEIRTSEYVHNFISMNGDNIGSNYSLEFPFQFRPDEFEETVNPEGKVELGQKEVRFKASPKEQFFFSPLNGSEKVDAQWKLTHLKQGLALSESGSFRTKRVNLWGWSHVVSPELFQTISLMPGKSTAWTRTYEMQKLMLT